MDCKSFFLFSPLVLTDGFTDVNTSKSWPSISDFFLLCLINRIMILDKNVVPKKINNQTIQFAMLLLYQATYDFFPTHFQIFVVGTIFGFCRLGFISKSVPEIENLRYQALKNWKWYPKQPARRHILWSDEHKNSSRRSGFFQFSEL